MIIRIIIGLFFIPICLLPVYLFGQIDLTLSAQLQQIVDNGTLNPGLKGLSACVISPNGEIWTGFAGEDGQGNLVTDTTVFYGGSTTKTMVAARIMQLVEQNHLDLQAPYTQYIAPIPLVDSSITIYQMLTHTSGAFNYLNNPDALQDAFIFNTTAVYTGDSVLRKYINQPAQFAPGTTWQYSNTNYYILGLVIEAVTGNSFHSELRNHLYVPGNFTHTSLGYYEAPAGPLGGIWIGQNNSPPLTNYSYISHNALLTAAWAAGAIVTTPQDLANWIRNLMQGQFVSSTSLQQMISPDPLSNNSYGLGIVRTQISGKVMYGHTGGIGAVTYMFHLPIENITIVTMSNTSIDQGQVFTALFHLLRNYSFPTRGENLSLHSEPILFPNPFYHSLKISGLSSCISSLQMMDTQGRMCSVFIENPEAGLIEIHPEKNISPGMYFLQLVLDDGRQISYKLQKRD